MAAEDPIEAISRTLLYEGYVLWPYRRSAIKNRRRWTFGVVYPRAFCDLLLEGDADQIHCAVLLDGNAATRVAVELRFLHVVHRQALCGERRELRRPVDRLDAGRDAHLTWDEAAERRISFPEVQLGSLLAGRAAHDIEVPAGSDEEEIRGASGEIVGSLRRTWELVRGELRMRAHPVRGGVLRLETTVANTSRWRGTSREEAQRRSMVSAHLVLRLRGGTFHSLADLPGHLRHAADTCRNEGVWPVLVGQPGSRDTVLASPIILDDHPRVAPESPGDLFDGGEIDQLLTLNILALTDDEKQELAATDPRARKILERTESLGREDLLRLHGTFRDPGGRRT